MNAYTELGCGSVHATARGCRQTGKWAGRYAGALCRRRWAFHPHRAPYRAQTQPLTPALGSRPLIIEAPTNSTGSATESESTTPGASLARCPLSHI